MKGSRIFLFTSHISQLKIYAKITLYANGQELVLKPKFFSRPPKGGEASMKPLLIFKYMYKMPIFAKISFFCVVQKIWCSFEILAIFT